MPYALQVEAAAAAAKVNLPADILETAKTAGIRSTALTAYLSLQVSKTAMAYYIWHALLIHLHSLPRL